MKVNDITYCKIMAYALLCTPLFQFIILFFPIPFLIILFVIIGSLIPTSMWLFKRNKSSLINHIGKLHFNLNLTSIILISIEITIVNYFLDSPLARVMMVLISFYEIICFFVVIASLDELKLIQSKSILSNFSFKFVK